MSRTRLFRSAPRRRPPRLRGSLQVELLEDRNLLSGLTLLPPSLVSVSSPLDNSNAPAGAVVNSEVEPQIAVDPKDPTHAVAIWQQDRYLHVGGARALVVSVTKNANAMGGATWSTPAAIPYFNSTDSTFNTIDPVTGQGYARYTDPWVTITPTGVVYASALAMTPTGPVPGHTAVLVSKSLDGGYTWSAPTVVIRDDAPNGTDPADLANDKDMIVADPTNANNVYVVWDRLNHPSDQQNFKAYHSLAAVREDMMFARTTDGGRTWNGGNYPSAVTGYPASDITNFQAGESAFANEIAVLPDGTLVDVFTHVTSSGNQAVQADKNVLGVMRSTDHDATWSAIIDGPAINNGAVTDPDTGAPVRADDPITSVAVDPTSGNLYAVWADARFSSKYSTDGIAFSLSTNGGKTWSDPIKVNQTPTNIPAADQQAFVPAVAVNSDGTVAVTYYDFRNNTAAAGALTDYWLVHASGSFTNPASWSQEYRLTDTSFDLEQAPNTSHGYFLGDYEGLAAAGKSFYALFAQAGSSSDPSNIWFRDPPPAPGAADSPVTQSLATDGLAGDVAMLEANANAAGPAFAPQGTGPGAVEVQADIGLGMPLVNMLSANNSLDLATLSAPTHRTTALDCLFAGGGETLFADALGSDGGSAAAD
jgi:hypothetical protein